MGDRQWPNPQGWEALTQQEAEQDARAEKPADDFWRTDVLVAIGDPSCTRDDVAVEYATALRAYGTSGEWREINAAIVDRWSMAALRYVKEKAWKLAQT